MHRLFAMAVAVLISQGAWAQDICSSRAGSDAIDKIEAFYADQPRALFTSQLHLRVGLGFPELAADGKWGPMTRGALCQMLETLTAINGTPPINWQRSDIETFADWLESAAFANATGGEFPD